MYFYEVGNMSAIAGVIPRLIKGDRGTFTGEQVREAARGDDLHFPVSRVVEIENTHNRAGGTCWTPAQVADVAKAAHDLGMKVHIDGARIFNALRGAGRRRQGLRPARGLDPVLPVQGPELPGRLHGGR